MKPLDHLKELGVIAGTIALSVATPAEYRDMQHLIAGIGMPFIQGYFFNQTLLKVLTPNKPYTAWIPNIPDRFLYYGATCVFWEGMQALPRGSFQWDQFACDIIGIGISFAVYKALHLQSEL